MFIAISQWIPTKRIGEILLELQGYILSECQFHFENGLEGKRNIDPSKHSNFSKLFKATVLAAFDLFHSPQDNTEILNKEKLNLAFHL